MQRGRHPQQEQLRAAPSIGIDMPYIYLVDGHGLGMSCPPRRADSHPHMQRGRHPQQEQLRAAPSIGIDMPYIYLVDGHGLGMTKPTGWGGLGVKCDAAVCYSPTPCRVQYHRRARS